MYEHEAELEGDFDWALFPAREQPIGGREWIASKGTVLLLVAACWCASPVLGVVGTCLAFALQDVRSGWRMAKLIPDKAGARICSLFTYAWGAWKAGAAASGSFVVCVFLAGIEEKSNQRNPIEVLAVMTALASIFLWFFASGGLTAAGIVLALRSGMRVWIGEGINQARMLLLAMLLVAFTCSALIPWGILLGRFDTRTSGVILASLLVGGFAVFFFGAPILILIGLDRLCRRVVADRPGKFGPKVSSVGKWNS